jgi:transposase
MSLPNDNNDDPIASPGRTRQTNKGDISPEERERILELHSHHYGMRQIALRIGRDRKTVRRILQDEGLLDRQPPDQTGKLDPFRETIQEKVRKRLTATRILREIRQQGYTGGRTILADYIRSIRSELAPRPRVKRRFETRPGQEMQADWTVYTVPIAASPTRVHALVCELAYSRKAHVHFYRNEREPTLLEGLALAFESFTGVTQRVVFDSMTTIVLGRIGSNGKPIWHPRFIDFAKFYGFEPFLCKVRDPDRKGKTEKFIRFLEDDCIRGAEFASFDELNDRVHDWIDNIANRRTHGTTGLIPDEVWLSERDFLIRLPETRFAVHEDAVRQVGPDATVWIQGTPYTA